VPPIDAAKAKTAIHTDSVAVGTSVFIGLAVIYVVAFAGGWLGGWAARISWWVFP
jgi:hypothetical protein